jgi:OOP family OmpA-OmpF porin
MVGADGCQLDDDGDGVVNYEDKCPATPAGAAVDRSGCPLDSDGDGVHDYRDSCPDSERGAKVDAKGCYIILDQDVTIDLNLEFDSNSSELRDSHGAQIQEAIDFLRQYPTANADIEGHTDSSGKESYNQALSEKRAKAVHDYLIETGRVEASRLSYVGKGEIEPIADNATAAGKQANRRVSVVVRGTKSVRQ